MTSDVSWLGGATPVSIAPSCDNPDFCLSFRLRCKPHPGPREGLNPLVFEKEVHSNLYAAGIADLRQITHGGFDATVT